MQNYFHTSSWLYLAECIQNVNLILPKYLEGVAVVCSTWTCSYETLLVQSPQSNVQRHGRALHPRHGSVSLGRSPRAREGTSSTRLSRSLLPRAPRIPLPYPILRRMSRPRGAALRLAPGRSGRAAAPRWARVHTPVRRGRWQVALGSARGHARAVPAQKCRLFFLSVKYGATKVHSSSLTSLG